MFHCCEQSDGLHVARGCSRRCERHAAFPFSRKSKQHSGVEVTTISQLSNTLPPSAGWKLQLSYNFQTRYPHQLKNKLTAGHAVQARDEIAGSARLARAAWRPARACISQHKVGLPSRLQVGSALRNSLPDSLPISRMPPGLYHHLTPYRNVGVKIRKRSKALEIRWNRRK